MLKSLFEFPDGDHIPIYVSETAPDVKLGDRGNTPMQVCYEHDVDRLHDDARAATRK